MATVEDLAVAALTRALDWQVEVPTTRSVLYRRLSTRQQQLFTLAAQVNREYYARTAIGILQSGAIDLRLLAQDDQKEAVRVNRIFVEAIGAANTIENGDYEEDALGSIASGGATLLRDATYAYHGSWSLKVTTAAASLSGLRWTTKTGQVLPALPNRAYTLLVAVYATGAAVGKFLEARFQWYTASVQFISQENVGPVKLVEGWQIVRLVTTLLSPPTTGAILLYFVTSNVPPQSSFTFWLDYAWLVPYSVAEIPLVLPEPAIGDEIFIIPPADDPNAYLTPRVTVRDHVIQQHAVDLLHVTKIRVDYAYRSDPLTASEDGTTVVELETPFDELLVIDLAKNLAQRAIGLEPAVRQSILATLTEEEQALLTDYQAHLRRFLSGQVSRMAQTQPALGG